MKTGNIDAVSSSSLVNPPNQSAGSSRAFGDLLATARGRMASDEKYDFTHITPSELHDTVNTLIRSGKLDLDQTTGLLGMMNPSSALNKVVYDGMPAASSNAPINVFDSLQKLVDAANARNESATARSLMAASQALSQYQA